MKLLTITRGKFSSTNPPTDYRGVVYTLGGRQRPYSAWLDGLLYEYTETQELAEETVKRRHIHPSS